MDEFDDQSLNLLLCDIQQEKEVTNETILSAAGYLLRYACIIKSQYQWWTQFDHKIFELFDVVRQRIKPLSITSTLILCKQPLRVAEIILETDGTGQPIGYTTKCVITEAGSGTLTIEIINDTSIVRLSACPGTKKQHSQTGIIQQ